MTDTIESYPVGITGHRRLMKDVRFETLIDAALQKIQLDAEGKPLIGYSSLAEGADRWVIQRLLNLPGARFSAVLPVPAALYQTDFTNQQSLVEFEHLLAQASEVIELPEKPNRNQSYLEASRFILSKVKALIAVWDGRPARGPGGTGQVVAEARQRQIPVAWVLAGVENQLPELIFEGFEH